MDVSSIGSSPGVSVSVPFHVQVRKAKSQSHEESSTSQIQSEWHLVNMKCNYASLIKLKCWITQEKDNELVNKN